MGRPALSITRTTVDALTWTAIVAPVECNAVDIHSLDTSVGFKVRTVAADANTEDTILGGGEYVIEASRERSETGARISPGTVLFVQADSGTGPIVARWLR